MDTTRVLFFEDDDADAVLLQQQVRLSDHRNIVLDRVALLREGLERLRDESFDAVLLDLGLPDASDSLHGLREVHAVNEDIPVVVLTGYGDTELAVAAMREGAQDYLLKGELDADRLARAVRFAVERRAHDRSKHELAAAKHKVTAASQVQQRLFPEPISIAGYDIAGRCRPAEETGGDFFDFFPVLRSYQGIALGDVSGHGLDSALTATQAATALRTLAVTYADPGPIMRLLREITTQRMPREKFFSLILVRLNVETNEVCCMSAGQPAYVLHANGEIRMQITPQLPVISSCIPVTDEAPQFFTLNRGELMLLYSDGIPERRQGRGLFEDMRMLEAVRENQAENAATIVDRVLEATNRFAGEEQQQDDLTLVVIKRL